MATEAELAASALAHAKKTSWSWAKYLNEIRTNPKYEYEKTEWFKAGADLEQGKHALPPPSPGSGLADAQARMFLAGSPLDCLQAPTYMVPVLSADFGNYQEEGDNPDEIYGWFGTVVDQLRRRFTRVEAWADCRNPTPYSEADRLVREFYLDGAWGQCENAGEFDNAFEAGATRMIGQLSGLRQDQKDRISADGVHLAFELYRNKMPWQTPDYGTQTSGVGGNAIGVYASAQEGAIYTPVETYKGLGYYVSGKDSVYGVGLMPADWQAL